MCPQQCKQASFNLLRGCTQQQTGAHHLFISASGPKQEHGLDLPPVAPGSPILHQNYTISSIVSLAHGLQGKELPCLNIT